MTVEEWWDRLKQTPMWALVTTVVVFVVIVLAGVLYFRSIQNARKSGDECASQLIANANDPSYTTTPGCRP